MQSQSHADSALQRNAICGRRSITNMASTQALIVATAYHILLYILYNKILCYINLLYRLIILDTNLKHLLIDHNLINPSMNIINQKQSY